EKMTHRIVRADAEEGALGDADEHGGEGNRPFAPQQLSEDDPELCCPLFQASWRKCQSKVSLWESIRGAFKRFVVPSMEVILQVIVADLKSGGRKHPISKSRTLPETCQGG
ncbi:MAG: hypothetical protein KJ630_10740, partial [Proteobacteria bacterium]|nr:hypothetical protein [Pseudomonadota bacterium]